MLREKVRVGKGGVISYLKKYYWTGVDLWELRRFKKRAEFG